MRLRLWCTCAAADSDSEEQNDAAEKTAVDEAAPSQVAAAIQYNATPSSLFVGLTHPEATAAAAGALAAPALLNNGPYTSGSDKTFLAPPVDGSGRQHDTEDMSAAGSAATLEARLHVEFRDLTFHELIGKGSFKTVYRGRWNNTTVAIVCMRQGGMLTEARVLQRLSNHPNIVQFYRWTNDGRGNEYMVIELVKCGSLDKLLLQYGSALRMRSKLMICEQICSAMCELVNEGVLHRDLAARNILVQSMEPVHIKVTDFGLARLMRVSEGNDSSSHDMSVPVRWSPPEALVRSEWSERSDVWSFGVTLWEIFSNGAEPFAQMGDQEVMQAVMSGQVLPRPAKCPRPVYELMCTCWHASPEARPTFLQIAQTFKRWREAFLASQYEARTPDVSSILSNLQLDSSASAPSLVQLPQRESRKGRQSKTGRDGHATLLSAAVAAAAAQSAAQQAGQQSKTPSGQDALGVASLVGPSLLISHEELMVLSNATNVSSSGGGVLLPSSSAQQMLLPEFGRSSGFAQAQLPLVQALQSMGPHSQQQQQLPPQLGQQPPQQQLQSLFMLLNPGSNHNSPRGSPAVSMPASAQDLMAYAQQPGAGASGQRMDNTGDPRSHRLQQQAVSWSKGDLMSVAEAADEAAAAAASKDQDLSTQLRGTAGIAQEQLAWSESALPADLRPLDADGSTLASRMQSISDDEEEQRSTCYRDSLGCRSSSGTGGVRHFDSSTNSSSGGTGHHRRSSARSGGASSGHRYRPPMIDSSIHMSFDVELPIEPTMSCSTLHSITNNATTGGTSPGGTNGGGGPVIALGLVPATNVSGSHVQPALGPGNHRRGSSLLSTSRPGSGGLQPPPSPPPRPPMLAPQTDALPRPSSSPAVAAMLVSTGSSGSSGSTHQVLQVLEGQQPPPPPPQVPQQPDHRQQQLQLQFQEVPHSPPHASSLHGAHGHGHGPDSPPGHMRLGLETIVEASVSNVSSSAYAYDQLHASRYSALLNSHQSHVPSGSDWHRTTPSSNRSSAVWPSHMSSSTFTSGYSSQQSQQSYTAFQRPGWLAPGADTSSGAWKQWGESQGMNAMMNTGGFAVGHKEDARRSAPLPPALRMPSVEEGMQPEPRATPARTSAHSPYTDISSLIGNSKHWG